MSDLHVAAKSLPIKKFSFLAVIVVIFLILTIFRPWVMVPPGYRGVVVNFGAVQPEVLMEGIHLRIPIYQKITLMDVRVQKDEAQADASSKDMQTIVSTIAVNYHINPNSANEIYQKLGPDYQNRIISPSVQESVKAVTASYTAEELISRRQEVSSHIKSTLEGKLQGYNILVDGFSVVNFSFSQEFNSAIESKQTAEQLALKARRDLERIKIEAEQKVASAKAEAESLKIQKEVVTAELVKLREIEAQMKAIEKWDGHLPSVTGGAMPFINVTK